MLQKTFVQLDLETTGTDTAKDRIVQIACQKFGPDLMAIDPLHNMIVNPLMPIPQGAAEVHGITDEMVKDKPTFAHYAKGLFAYMQGHNVAGYNIREFDVPLLSEEFARCGIKWPEKGTSFFDSYKIVKLKERQNLEWALKFYTGEEIENAHDAAADINTAQKVLRGQMNFYPEMQAMTDEQLDLFCTDGVKYLDIACKIALNQQGLAVYAFGKDRDKVIVDFPGFGEWMLKNGFTSNTKDIIRAIIYKKQTLF